MIARLTAIAATVSAAALAWPPSTATVPERASAAQVSAARVVASASERPIWVRGRHALADPALQRAN
jgi:hypothetical protein